MIRRAAKIAAAIAGAFCFAPLAGAAEGGPALECFTVAQTRQEIALHGLADPFPLVRKASGEAHGQPLSAQLCRNGETFIYEITVLRRDGRIEKVPFNAANGKPHPAQAEHR